MRSLFLRILCCHAIPHERELPKGHLLGTSLNPDRLQKLKYEGMTTKEIVKEVQGRLRSQPAIPWSRTALYDQYLMENSPLRAEIEGRRGARWAWYGQEWGETELKRSRPVIRYHDQGNLTLDTGIKGDARFHQQGACFIAKTSYYYPDVQAAYRSYYHQGTSSLSGYLEVLRILQYFLGASLFEGDMRRAPWLTRDGSVMTGMISWKMLTDLFDTWRKDVIVFERENTLEDHARESLKLPEAVYKDYVDMYGPSRMLKPFHWFTKYVVKPKNLSSIPTLLKMLQGVIRSMRLVELPPSRTKVHPGFMESMDIESRVQILNEMATVAKGIMTAPFDNTVVDGKSVRSEAERLQSNISRLLKAYYEIIEMHGTGRYLSSSSPYGFTPSKSLRVSLADEQSAKKQKARLKSVIEKILAVTKDTGQTIHVDYSAVPSRDLLIRKADAQNYEVVQMGGWQMNEAFREGVPAVMKFSGVTDQLIKKAYEHQILKALIHSALEPVQIAYAKVKKVHPITAYFKMSLLCYFDPQYGRTRMIELLQTAVPGLERPDPKSNSAWPSGDDSVSGSEGLVGGGIPQKDWMAVGFTYDSWSHGKRLGKSLLKAYHRDQAELKGIRTRSSNQYVSPIDDEANYCDGNELIYFLMQRISLASKKNSLVAPEVKIKTNGPPVHKILKDCLNLVPPGAEAFFAGNPTPGKPKPLALSTFISEIQDSVTFQTPGAVSVGGEVTQKAFVPRFNFEIVDSYQVNLTPDMIRTAAKELVKDRTRERELDRARYQSERQVMESLREDLDTVLNRGPRDIASEVVKIPEYEISPSDISTSPGLLADTPLRFTIEGPLVYGHTFCQADGTWSAAQRITVEEYEDMISIDQLDSPSSLATTDPAIFTI